MKCERQCDSVIQYSHLKCRSLHSGGSLPFCLIWFLFCFETPRGVLNVLDHLSQESKEPFLSPISTSRPRIYKSDDSNPADYAQDVAPYKDLVGL